MTETTAGDMGTRHDAATFNEVNALINRDAEGFVPFSQRLAITNRFLDWHHAKVAQATAEVFAEARAAVAHIGKGAGSQHFRHGRETMREDAVERISRVEAAHD